MTHETTCTAPTAGRLARLVDAELVSHNIGQIPSKAPNNRYAGGGLKAMSLAAAQWVERNWLLRRILRRQLAALYRSRDAASDRARYESLKARDFVPDAVLVQISRACNLKCSMCGWAVWARNRGFMKMDLYRRILSEMKLNGIRRLNLTNPQGEPLLSPHAIECIELGIAEGFDVHINTNCTTLGDRNIDGLVANARSGRLSIQASFSGYDKRSHETVYVGSQFERSSAKLQKLNAALAAENLQRYLTVNGIIMDREELPLHIGYLERLGIDRKCVTMGLPDNFAGIVQVGRLHRVTGLFSFKHELAYRSLRLCNLLAYYVLIYDDGKVSACSCRDSEGVMEIGDITTQSLAEIRNGARFRAMMDAFMRRDLSQMPLCQKCDIPYGDRENEKLFHADS